MPPKAHKPPENCHEYIDILENTFGRYFWGLKFCNCSWKFGSLPRKGKVDLCTTNGSKVLIYLTLLYFIFHCTLVSNAKGNIAKSNKSELWNRLSYRGLPYLFKVRSQTFRNVCQISRSQPQNLEADYHLNSTTSKGLSEN